MIEDEQAIFSGTSDQTAHVAFCVREFVMALAAGSAIVIAILIYGFIHDLLLA
ncbi:hypothetical protein ACK9YZ_31230 [Rhizobium sp. ZK1]|uniref:hypothetical protein n=1 Tax=Rhizobium sp. ZK1 TaxID=3389872 RepID=UPI0039F72557